MTLQQIAQDMVTIVDDDAEVEEVSWSPSGSRYIRSDGTTFDLNADQRSKVERMVADLIASNAVIAERMYGR